MPFFVKSQFLFIFIVGGLLTSCLPSNSKKSSVEFTDNRIKPITEDERVIPIEASFESVYEHLIKKSCLKCHNSKSPQISFESKQEILDNSDDIIFYIEDGCDFGTCMPPQNPDGTNKAPLPTEEILKAFKEWVDENN
ncbi:MAG: hypothetical protein KC493_06305 [Bacteriovoracaceae bacterium]|nr:hypothetical protein [Bacteriovoracaceae bacterium]